jgi:hypothetical protein
MTHTQFNNDEAGKIGLFNKVALVIKLVQFHVPVLALRNHEDTNLLLGQGLLVVVIDHGYRVSRNLLYLLS